MKALIYFGQIPASFLSQLCHVIYYDTRFDVAVATSWVLPVLKVEFYLTTHTQNKVYFMGPPLNFYMWTDIACFHNAITTMFYFNQTVLSRSAVRICFLYLNPHWVRIPVGSTDFSSSPPNPDHIWAPSNLLLKGYWVLLLGCVIWN